MMMHLLCFLIIASTCICNFGPVRASTTETEINLTGVYKWTIVKVIDNSHGKEYVTQQAIEIKSEVDKELTVAELHHKLSSSGRQFDATMNDARITHVTGSNAREYSHHEELMNKLFAVQSTTNQNRPLEIVQKEITVPAGEIVVLYQLHFTAPGISLSLPITSTNLKEVDVQLKFKVEPMSNVKLETAPKLKAEPAPKPTLIANGSVFAVQTFHGTYLSAGHDSVVRQVKDIQEKEKWTFVHLHDDFYGLWSVHGTYLRAHKGGEGSKVDLHTWGQMSWGKWKVVITPVGEIALSSVYGTFLRAHRESSVVDLQVVRNDWVVEMEWEQFHLVPIATDEPEL